MFITEGIFHTPFYIIIRSENKINQDNVLEKLNLKNYKFVEDENERHNDLQEARKLFIYDNFGWIHIMDDWFYTLWHNKEIRNTLIILGKEFEIFYFSIGDSDESLEFVYYKNGELKRKFIRDDFDFKGGEIKENIGTPFECEKICMKSIDPYDKVKPIINSIGIKLSYETREIKCYKLSEFEKFKFNINEY